MVAEPLTLWWRQGFSVESQSPPPTTGSPFMKFRIKSTCFINLPTHLANDPPGLLRNLPQTIKAEPMYPVEIALPDDIDPNSISRTWEPLDDRAREAQAKLSAGNRSSAAAPVLTTSALADALLALSPEDRKALTEAMADKDRKAAAAASMEGTMKAVTERGKKS